MCYINEITWKFQNKIIKSQIWCLNLNMLLTLINTKNIQILALKDSGNKLNKVSCGKIIWISFLTFLECYFKHFIIKYYVLWHLTILHKTPNFKSTRAAYHTGFGEKYHSAADIVRGAVAMEFQAKQWNIVPTYTNMYTQITLICLKVWILHKF